MSEATEAPVITVRQEVEAVLRLALDRHVEAVNYLNRVAPGTEDFHDAVTDEIEAIIEAYVNPPKADPSVIGVGDTVRIREGAEEIAGEGNEIGTEFVVTEIIHAPWRTWDGVAYSFYVKGDPAGRGVWDVHIEKVSK